MPKYLYRCELKHEREIEHPVSQLDSVHTCKCGGVMHRVPQAFMVNWGGLPPHLADARPPQIAKYVHDSPEIVSRTRDAKAKRTEYEQKAKELSSTN